MSDIVDKNFRLASIQQVADSQLRAFLRVICQIGEVLDKQSQYPRTDDLPTLDRGAIVSEKSTDTIEKIVTTITDRDRTHQIFFRERKPSESGLAECLGQNHQGECQDDEEKTVDRTSPVRALAESEEESTARAESRKTSCNT